MNIIVSSPRGTNYFRVDEPVPQQHRQLTQRQLTNRFLNEPYPSLYSPYPAMLRTGNDRERTPSNFSRKPVAKRKMKLLLTYGLDWVVTILIIGLFYLLDSIEGFKRQFSIEDKSIQHTFAEHERVPPFALYMIALVAPAVIMPIVNLLTVRSWWDFHNSWLGLLLGLATTGSLTQVVKVTVGRPRPDLIDRCQPVQGASDTPVYGLVTAAICTSTDHARLKDGFRSFFSGHSSLSFAGLGFLSFYLAGKMHLFDERGHTGKSWIALTPLTGALLVAISRTMDYRHHWQDVLVGSIVGLLLSYFSYRQYYPTLASPFSHRPYSPRIPRYLQEEANIPSPEGTPAKMGPGPQPHGGEDIELAGTVKRGGEDLSEMWRRDREEENTRDQHRSAPKGDAAHIV
ncbi:PAP2-domain-containing protein [Ceratobasidium sp. AG-I]|nr:PAP2-domain-containing protein [Ceratobasidium sp. AG-I]